MGIFNFCCMVSPFHRMLLSPLINTKVPEYVLHVKNPKKEQLYDHKLNLHVEVFTFMAMEC